MLDGTARTFLAEMLIIPTGILGAAFLARYLSPAGYGLFILAATSIAWVEATIGSIFSRAVVKFVSEAKDWRPVGATLLRLHLAAGIGAAVLVWLCAAIVGDAFKEPALSGYLKLFALDIPLFTLTQAHRYILVGLGRFRQQALSSALRWTSRLLLILLFLQLGLSITGAILASLASSLVAFCASRLYIRPSLFRRSTFPAHVLWADGMPLSLLALSMRFFDRLDLFMLKALGATAAEAGFYGAALNLALMPGLFALSFSPLLLSTLARVLREGDEALARTISRDALRVALWPIPFACLTAGASEDIVRAIYGEQFKPAAPLLALLIVGAVALAIYSVGTAILIAAGRQRVALLLSIPLPLVAALGHLWLIPRWGAPGAAMVTTIVSGLGAGLTVYAVFRCWRILPPLATLARAVLTGALAFTLSAMWPAMGPLFFSLKLMMIALLIPLALFFLNEFHAGEIALARSLMRLLLRPTARQAPREV
ncbi:MAG TPA: oligosaccharide flippase family protein [Pyrinomonadaceae bacterium]|jgi:O-antigen/teichoic acid export membrane protein